MKLPSIFERRFRHVDDEAGGKEVLLDQNGSPTLVATGGQLRGVRAVDGSLIPLPERRLEDIPDTEWIWIGGEMRRRWIE